MTKMYTKRINKLNAFVKRDFIIEASYKLNFIITLLNSLLPVVSFFFISKIFSGDHQISQNGLNGDYFSFVLIGIAFTRFFQLAIETFSSSIKRAQMAGCLEAILSSQTSTKAVVLFSAVYSFLSAGVQLFLIFVTGYLFFGFSFSNTNIMSMLLVLVVSLLAFISLGVFAAAFTVMFKQGEPISWFFGAVSGLIGGALFPISVMPTWLQYISAIFPITYSLDALRLSMLNGYSIAMLDKHILTLFSISAILLPISLYTFNWAVEKGKKEGTLIQY